MLVLYRTLWTALCQPCDVGDEVQFRDFLYLQRSYYQLLAAIAANDVLKLVFGLGDECKTKIFLSIASGIGVQLVSDPITQKVCYSFLEKLLDTKENLPEVDVAHIHNFISSAIIPDSIALLGSAEFRYDDAQYALLLTEIIGFYKKAYSRIGESTMLSFQNAAAVALKVSSGDINNIMDLIRSGDGKQLQTRLRKLLLNSQQLVANETTQ